MPDGQLAMGSLGGNWECDVWICAHVWQWYQYSRKNGAIDGQVFSIQKLHTGSLVTVKGPTSAQSPRAFRTGKLIKGQK